MRMTRTLPPLLLALACNAPKVTSAGPPSGGGGQDASAKVDGSPQDANFSFTPVDALAGEAAAPTPDLDCGTAAKEKGNAGCHFYAVPLPVRSTWPAT